MLGFLEVLLHVGAESKWGEGGLWASAMFLLLEGNLVATEARPLAPPHSLLIGQAVTHLKRQMDHWNVDRSHCCSLLSLQSDAVNIGDWVQTATLNYWGVLLGFLLFYLWFKCCFICFGNSQNLWLWWSNVTWGKTLKKTWNIFII